MLNLIKKLFTPPIFEDDQEKTRSAELLNAILSGSYLIITLILLALMLGDAPASMIMITATLFILIIALHILSKYGYIRQAGILLVIFMTLALTITIALGGTIRVASLSFFILASVISGLIISTQALYWSAGFNAIIVFILLWAENTGQLPEETYVVSAQPGIMFAAASVMTALLLHLALEKLNQALSHAQREKNLALENVGLEKRVEEHAKNLEERSAYLEISAEVSRAVASITDPDKLILQVVDLIKDHFNLYYVGLFLVDERRKWAILKAGTGEAGKTMLERAHRLEVGKGMIGWSISNAEARIALDVGEDAVRFDNPDLPETRSEGALPLRSRGRVLGALTIQSRQSTAFSQDVINILQTMADQIAIALDNAELLARSEGALKAEREAYGRLSQEEWTALLQRENIPRYISDAPNIVHPLGTQHLTESSEALLKGDILQDDGFTAVFPIEIRGHILGGVKLSKKEEQGVWSKRELALAKDLVTRPLSIALESARLFDQSQRQVAREHVISQASAKMRETLDIEAVLETVALEFRNALGIAKAKVSLIEDQSQSTEA